VNVSPLCLGASLQRLGTDHIDLDQVHRPEADADVNPSDAGWSNPAREPAAGRR
jgi:aryl-alcohol dehydrogenase-like predicted oxidoreductase